MKNKAFLLAVPVLAIAGLCTLSGCKKDPPPNPGLIPIDYTVLPEATQEGKNTFGCLVDGEVWVPRVELFVPWYDKAASLHENDKSGVGNITCRVLTENQDDFMQLIFGPSNMKVGKFSMTPSTSTDCGMLIGLKPWYKADSKDSTNNWVKLTMIDTAKNIVSGQFHFILYNVNDNSDKITISQGRFDMPYYPQ